MNEYYIHISLVNQHVKKYMFIIIYIKIVVYNIYEIWNKLADTVIVLGIESIGTW